MSRRDHRQGQYTFSDFVSALGCCLADDAINRRGEFVSLHHNCGSLEKMERLAVRCCVVLCIFLFFHSVIHALENQSVFRRTSLQGSASVAFLKRWTVRSKAECAVACSERSECKSFSVRPRTRECSLYSSRITTADVLPASSSEQEVFYWKRHDDCPSGQGYALVPGTEKCLRVERALQFFWDAEATCEASGGHLLILEDLATWTAVRAFLEGVAQDVGSMFVGGVKTSSGQWLWLDGRAVEENLWHPTQPDGSYGNECCLQLWWGARNSSFTLLDDQTEYEMASICEQ